MLKMIEIKAFARASALVCLVALAGCSVGAELAGAPKLSESSDVENAPWPRLADGPGAVSTDPSAADNTKKRVQLGDDIDSALSKDVAKVEAEKKSLGEAKDDSASLAAEIARLKAEARALRDQPIE